MSERICVAKITSAHGIKGFVKVKIFTDKPTDLEQYNPLFVSKSTDKTLTITLKNSVKTQWVAEIEGITDRNQAEELRGTELFIEENALPSPDEGEFYYKDLIGMTVLNHEGTLFGTVLAVQNFGAGDLLEIKPPTGDSFYFPFNDEHCPLVDQEKKIIHTKDIESFIF